MAIRKPRNVRSDLSGLRTPLAASDALPPTHAANPPLPSSAEALAAPSGHIPPQALGLPASNISYYLGMKINIDAGLGDGVEEGKVTYLAQAADAMTLEIGWTALKPNPLTGRTTIAKFNVIGEMGEPASDIVWMPQEPTTIKARDVDVGTDIQVNDIVYRCTEVVHVNSSSVGLRLFRLNSGAGPFFITFQLDQLLQLVGVSPFG